MKIVFSKSAHSEVKEALYYYDDIAPKLSNRLLAEVKKATKHILDFPFAWSKIGNNQRKYVLNIFPYMIIFKIYENTIVIASFAHLHQKPESYID